MNSSAISSIMTSYAAQQLIPSGNKDSNDSGGIRPHHHDHGRGAFMKDVLQSLQNLGLNFPNTNAGQTTATNSSGTDSQNTSASATDVRQALHTFLHDLHQALQQSTNTTQQTTASTGTGTDSDGDNDNSGASSSGTSNGYSNFATNLQNLISSLNNGSGTQSALQSDFSNLVTALGGSSSNVKLQDFLTQMENNLGATSQPSATGSLLTTQA